MSSRLSIISMNVLGCIERGVIKMLSEIPRHLRRGGIARWREPTLVLASPIKVKLSVGIRTRLHVAITVLFS